MTKEELLAVFLWLLLASLILFLYFYGLRPAKPPTPEYKQINRPEHIDTSKMIGAS